MILKTESRILVLIHNEFSLFNALSIYSHRTHDLHLIIFDDWNVDRDLLSRLARIVWRFEVYSVKSGGGFVGSWTSQLKVARRIMASIVPSNYCVYALVLDRNYCELKVMELFLRESDKPQFVFIEDGAHSYFHNGVVNRGLASNRLLSTLRRGGFMILGIRRAYQFVHPEMGGNKLLEAFYLHYPKSQRELYKADLVREIEKDSFKKVVRSLANTAYELDGTLFILDHSSTVQDLNYYADKIRDFTSYQPCTYLKFHPRESEDFIGRFNGLYVVERKTTIERLLAGLPEGSIKVFGLTSTSLMSAKIFGFEAVSLMTEFGVKNKKAEQFFNNLRIPIK